MRRLIGGIVPLVLLVACGGGGQTRREPLAPEPIAPPPVLAASLTTAGGLSFPDCPSRELSAYLGIPTVTCPSFTGVASNTGSGCAGNVHGTTIVYDGAGHQTGSAEWSYRNTVRPSEQFIYSGGHIAVPTGQVDFVTTFNWDNMPCN